MKFNGIASLFLVPTISLFAFQNCSKQDFSPIDSAAKLSTMENHAGIGDDRFDSNQYANGLGGSDESSSQIDGGLGSNGGNPMNPNYDGGLGFNPNYDSGVGMLNPNYDGGLGSNPNIDGGLMPNPNYDGGNPINPNYDGGLAGNPNYEPGGTNTPNIDNGNPNMPDPNSGFNAGKDPVTDPTNGTFRVIRWCRGNDNGSTMKRATDATIQVKDKKSRQVVCEGTGISLLDDMRLNARATIPNCDFSSINNKDLVVQVVDQNGKTLSDGTDNASGKNAFDDGKLDSDAETPGNDKEIVAIHLLNDNEVSKREFAQREDCDAYNNSPLVVDMRRENELSKIFQLSSPRSGVKFDIAGENAIPAHDPKKISWMKDPRIMPIVLPKGGQVDGINELFGDNTKGPDGRFAAHGFAALAKHDSDGNTYIDKDDPVFSELRVWYDRDLNGVAAADELYTLDRAGIEIIDLNFDPNFYKRDRYGNEIKLKSVVKLKSGQLKPVFDIWFTVNKLIQD